MSIRTGKDGSVDGISCLTQWQVSRTAALTKYAASCTDRGTGATSGNINESGSLSGLGGNPPITPGVPFAFVGIADQTPSEFRSYGGTVLPLSLSINCDKEGGGNINWSSNFGVQGELTPGTAAAAAIDPSEYNVHPGASDVADASTLDTDGTDEVPIAGFRKWSLSISVPEKTYVQNGLVYRQAGNLECSVSIDVYSEDLRNALTDPNTLRILKLFVDDTDFWNLEWVRWSDASNFVVNRGTQDLMGYTLNAMWTSVSDQSALGHITRPGGAHLFGT